MIRDIALNITFIISYFFFISQCLDWVYKKGDLPERRQPLGTYGAGGVYGLLGIVLMFLSIRVTETVILDLRHLAIVTAAIFFGAPAAMLSAFTIAIGRILLFGLNVHSVNASVLMLAIGVVCAWMTRLPWRRSSLFLSMNAVSIVLIYITLSLNIPNHAQLWNVFRYEWAFCLIGGLLAYASAEYIFRFHELHRKLSERTTELSMLIDRLKESNELLKRLSQVDGLTGIANRRTFDEQLGKEWLRCSRSGSLIALIMIDIDYFKAYNDACGHLKGDDCLKLVALTIQGEARRSGDFAARYGGEEFAVILPETDLDGALVVAENIRSMVESLKLEHKQSKVSPWVTVSIGSASLTATGTMRPADLIALSDAALYKGKREGRNRVTAAEEASETGDPSG